MSVANHLCQQHCSVVNPLASPLSAAVVDECRGMCSCDPQKPGLSRFELSQHPLQHFPSDDQVRCSDRLSLQPIETERGCWPLSSKRSRCHMHARDVPVRLRHQNRSDASHPAKLKDPASGTHGLTRTREQRLRPSSGSVRVKNIAKSNTHTRVLVPK
jgi:hypothetical protein